MRRLLLTVALSIGFAAPSAAQSLKLDFHDGLVSVDATNVPVRTILTEWGKIGGTKIVGAEKLTGLPLTVKLINVPEAKALETILRSAAGYMAAPRATASGPSMYDRILVLATTSTPPPAPTVRPGAANTNGAFNGAPRPPQRPQRTEDQQPADESEPDDNPPNPPVFTFPQPTAGQPGVFTNAPPPMTGGAQNITIAPATPSTSPTMPTGAATPGVIIQPPPPAPTPGQPGSMIRPPGRQ
ncbi:MAG TPA: hypothetical protein VEC39_14530 [Vicinamibacterales bacterium]|nr:hypothetical protein [Vicinamibacterales bacterium]